MARSGMLATLAALTCALAAFVVPAAATPSVTFQARAVPIPGFPHTGNLFGAGAMFRLDYMIAGTEFDGAPWPLVGISVQLPAGTKIRPAGFPTCPEPLAEQSGSEACPRRSLLGSGAGVASVAPATGGRLAEPFEVTPLVLPGPGLELRASGHSPLSFATPWPGVLTAGAAGSAPDLTTTIPTTAPEGAAGPSSIESLDLTLGGAGRSVGTPSTTPKARYFFALPKTCPLGGQSVGAVLTFAQGGDPSKPLGVSVSSRIPCPRRALVTPPPPSPPPPPPLPQTLLPGTGGVATAPANGACAGVRRLIVHILRPKGLRYRTAAVYLNGRRVALVHRPRVSARVVLSAPGGVGAGLRVTVTTSTGRRLTGVRVYGPCAAVAGTAAALAAQARFARASALIKGRFS
ncbi:MAG TPA: hypothetical protein VII01_10795 [Solirubrobacteraceae bacterium]